MSGIATELDQKLRTLDPETAATVERLVRDALQLANARQANGSHWPPRFWEQIRADWGDEPFERPTQGEFEKREDW